MPVKSFMQDVFRFLPKTVESASMSDLNGFLVVHKPSGITSHDVVGFARRRLKTKKIGHTGTLDPLATGVLVLGVGNGTRLIEYLVGCDKEYSAELTFGGVSDTFDAEGTIKPNLKAAPFTQADLEAALPRFIGRISQVPPVFSAIKIGGQSAHRLARAGGEMPEMQPRQITIHDIKITKFNYPKAELHIVCGSGTYIRSLAHDLGQTLGTGAYLSKLTRTRAGQFTLADAATFHQIRAEKLLPIETGVTSLLRLNLTKLETEKIRMGQKIAARDCDYADLRAGFHEGQLIAILACEPEKGLLKPVKVLH